VPNTNGVVLCSTGNNQNSPAAGYDILLTSGLATYQRSSTFLTMDSKLTTRSTKSSLGMSRKPNVKLWLRKILANLSLTCLSVNRIFIILSSRRYSFQIHYLEQRLWGLP
jgi:hypothetical protein